MQTSIANLILKLSIKPVSISASLRDKESGWHPIQDPICLVHNLCLAIQKMISFGWDFMDLLCLAGLLKVIFITKSIFH